MTGAGATRSCRNRRCARSPASSTPIRFEAYVSSNRTCELALGLVTGRPYRSIVQIAEELTRP